MKITERFFWFAFGMAFYGITTGIIPAALMPLIVFPVALIAAVVKIVSKD